MTVKYLQLWSDLYKSKVIVFSLFANHFISSFNKYTKAFLLMNIVNLLTTPALIHILGTFIWSKLILAQFIGQIFAVLIDAGFSSYGASEISNLQNSRKKAFLLQSKTSRFAVLVFVFPFYLLVHYFILGGFQLGFLMIGVSSLIQALNSSWYHIATGDSSTYLKRIIAPKSLAGATGTIACAITNSIYPYGAFLLVGAVYSLSPKFPGHSDIQKINLASSLDLARRDVFSLRFIPNIVGNLYNFLPILIFGKINQLILPELALADKISKYILGFSQPVVAATQGAIFNVKLDKLSSNLLLKRFQLLLILLSVPFILIFSLLFPIFSSLVSSGQLNLSNLAGIPVAITTYASIIYWFQSSIFVPMFGLQKLSLFTNSLAIVLVISSGLYFDNWSAIECLWTIAICYSLPLLILCLGTVHKLNNL